MGTRRTSSKQETMSGAMGMMNEGYFVGRREILDWLNTTFQVNVQKIEELGSGAMYCQIVDAVFPGSVPLHKVKFAAKLEPEFISNFKVLQTALNKHKIDRYVEVDKLVKKSYQHNLELAQFMKAWYDSNCSDSDYNAAEMRAKAGAVMPTPASAPKRSSNAAPPKKVAENAPTMKSKPLNQSYPKKSPAPTATPTDDVLKLQGEKKKAEEENVQLKLTIDGLEKERDFYFGKLRDIEVLCQSEPEDNPFVQQILSILYQTEENFVAPAEGEGEEEELADENDASVGNVQLE